MLIEGDRAVVFGLDHERKGLCVTLQNAERGIGEQGAVQSLAMKALIDRQTTDERDGQGRIAREPFQHFRRQIVGRNARRRERVVTGNYLLIAIPVAPTLYQGTNFHNESTPTSRTLSRTSATDRKPPLRHS
jgi:hypothetical protein